MKQIPVEIIIIALIAASLIFMVVRSSHNNKEIDQTKEGQPIKDISSVGNFSKIQFDGHTFIVISYGDSKSICHDPNCNCLKK